MNYKSHGIDDVRTRHRKMFIGYGQFFDIVGHLETNVELKNPEPRHVADRQSMYICVYLYVSISNTL